MDGRKKVDSHTLKLGEEMGGLRKETAELNNKMTRLTNSMERRWLTSQQAGRSSRRGWTKSELEKTKKLLKMVIGRRAGKMDDGTFRGGWTMVPNLHHFGWLGD